MSDCEKLHEDIAALEAWSDDWLLRFHPQKCKVMQIGSGHPVFNYTMKGTGQEQITLEVTPQEKDLGVVIDRNLKFNDHINQSVKKANRIVGLIRRTFTSLDCKTFPLLYRSLVRPHLEYGNTIWAPRFAKDVTMIENVQRRATKLVPGLYEIPYEERLRILNLPSLVYRRRRGDAIELYKYTHSKYAVNTAQIKFGK